MHSDSQLSFSIRALFALGMLGLTLALMHFAADYLNALLLAWLIVLVASPLLYWMRGKGAPNWLSFVATLLAILIAFIGFGLIMILGFNQLVEAIPTYVEQTEELTNYLNQWIDSLGMNMGSVGETVSGISPPDLVKGAVGFLGGLLSSFSVVILVISIVLAGYINRLGGSLFVYIQSLYAFFAPPFGAVFLLGILFRRINGQGALTAVVLGFTLGIAMKLYIQFVPDHRQWLEPYAMQSIINWGFCVVVCVAVSLATAPPRPEQVTDQLTFNWKQLNIFTELGRHWYSHVVLWWSLFVVIIVTIILMFSGLFL